MGNLGETLLSFGFEGTGKFSSAGNFESLVKSLRGWRYNPVLVELESKPLAFIGFSENGKWLGFAKGLMLAQGVLNVEDGLAPEQVYKPWASALDDGNEIMGPSSSDISDCEVVMVAGLPASGKTTWADEYPEKLSVLLGRNLILDEMRIAVVAFPKPEDLEFRVDKRFKEMGMEVPADATNNMIVLQNYALSKSKEMPVPDELSDQHSVADSLDHFIRKFLLNSIEGSRGDIWRKVCLVELLAFHYLHLRLHLQGPRINFLLACSSILEDITLLLRETANFRIVSPSITRDFGDLTSKLKTGKSRRRSSGSC
ncbi:nuclear ribonucleoprotein [Salix suchowensis]|nr:nuclear ribonucleoprotein [Salix suchowensis]